MAMTDREVTQWLSEYDAGLEADVERAERAISQANPPKKGGRGKTRDAESHVSGDVLRQIRAAHTDDGLTAPEPWPGERDRNWFRDLGRRTAVGGRERILLDALLNRVWTKPDDPHKGRFNGQWTGWIDELRGDCGMSMSYATMKRAIAGLIAKGVIERRLRGRVRVSRGRGKSEYRVLPTNSYERRES